MRLLPRSVLAIALGAALTVATLPLASAAPEGVKTVGPSFSCKAPGLTRVERTICDDPSLAKLDLKLWYATMEALDGSYAALELNGNEATWLHHVRDECTTTSCLTDAYHARIAFMQRTDTDTAARAKRESAPKPPTIGTRPINSRCPRLSERSSPRWRAHAACASFAISIWAMDGPRCSPSNVIRRC